MIAHVLLEALQVLVPDEHKIVVLGKSSPARSPTRTGISAELRITRNRAERTVFRNARLTGFFMAPAPKKDRVIKQLERLCALSDNIIALSSAAAPGALHQLPIKTTSPRQLQL